MFITAFLIAVCVIMVVTYVQETLQEQRRLQRRLEKIAFSSYELYQKARSKGKAGELFKDPKRTFHIDQKQLKKWAMMSVVVVVIAFVLNLPFMGPIILVASIFCGIVFFISYQKKSRENKIRLELPGTMDLMIICLGAGLGIAAAFERVAREMEGSVLGEEFRQIVFQSNSGVPLEESLRNFSARVDLPEVAGIIGPIIQAHKSGASIAETFEIQALTLREKMKLSTKEKVMRIPVIVMIPVTLFILPVIFVVTLTPAFFSAAQNAK